MRIGKAGILLDDFPGNEEDAYSTKVEKHGRHAFEILEFLQFCFQLSGLKIIIIALNYRI